MNDNYFRLKPYRNGPLVYRDVYPFDGNDATSVELAYRSVRDRANKVRSSEGRLVPRQEIVVWRQPACDGPWRELMTVGQEDIPAVLLN